MFLNKISAFIKRDFATEISYRLSFSLRLARILVTVLIFYFISRLFDKGASGYLQEYGGEYFPFVLIGVAFSEYLMFGLRSFSESIRDEQMMGTLEAILTTPTRVSTIVMGSSVWNFVFSSISVFIYLLLGVVFFGLDLSNMNLLSGVIILILTVLSFSGIGIISAALIIILKKGDPLTWFMGICLGFLGGVYFPVDIMPGFLRIFSFFLPVTYSLRGLRLALLKGYGLGMLIPEIIPLFIFCVFLVPVSIGMFKLALNKAKRDGSLVHY